MIKVRRACSEDAEAVWRIFQDEKSYAGTLQVPYPSRDVWRKRVAEADGEIVGHAGIHKLGASPRRAHAMGLGIVVRSDWHGKGVGRALMAALIELADGWLPVTRIELTVFTDNENALKLYREFGFEIEGTHKAYALRDGKYVDTYSMARVRCKPPPAEK